MAAPAHPSRHPATRSPHSGPPAWVVRATAPVAAVLAGRRWFPLWAVMHHVGRKTGKPYAIPVAIIPTHGDHAFLIGLPWGEQTNWVRNVLAAQGATVTWKGRDHAATDPRVITQEAAVVLAKGPLRRVVGSGRFPAFLQLSR